MLSFSMQRHSPPGSPQTGQTAHSSSLSSFLQLSQTALPFSSVG